MKYVLESLRQEETFPICSETELSQTAEQFKVTGHNGGWGQIVERANLHIFGLGGCSLTPSSSSESCWLMQEKILYDLSIKTRNKVAIANFSSFYCSFKKDAKA